ncbi:MAG: DotU family type IV/VI secretion system protein [Acidobacteria bacterium]|nr:DotU family type IV/VI secretion system protein [Acidobacteriota bacterium]
MSTATVRPSPRAKPVSPETSALKLDRLALVYEGILTAAVRIGTGRQQVQDPDRFRARMLQALREISSTAARKGYAAEDIEEANFAVVAFLDETILTHDPCSAEWARKSLGEELFGQRSAGEVFFKRLETLRANRDTERLAEVLEVYYLCLLLGYEGKFAGGSKAELQLLMTNLRDRIEAIFGRNPEFSPDGKLPDEPRADSPATDPLYRQIKIFAAAALALAILCYVCFSWQLSSRSREVRQAIEERLHE